MNQTMITEILLIGFQNLQDLRFLVIFMCLVMYFAAMTGNLIIILMVSASHHLRSPMFFYLCHLSFSDMLLISNIVPFLVHIVLFSGGLVSLKGCMVQFFFYGVSATTECLLLTAMSYDRYLAICSPLHYATIMSPRFCLYIVVFCWSLGFIITLVPILLIQTLWFCGSNVIDHFFCDLGPLLELSCSDTSFVKYEVLSLSGLLTIIPFVFIVVTYCYIFVTIVKITSITGRQKTFSTCSSHLAVVCTYYGALFAIYVVPRRGTSLNINKVVSLMYSAVTPLFNPVIYGLRNQEIKATFRNYLLMYRRKSIK